MSKVATDWALRQHIADGTMKPLLVHLGRLHLEAKAPFPSQGTLAAATGKSARTVREALRVLEYFGVIRREARSSGSSGRTSDRFHLTLDRHFTLTRQVIADAHRALRKRRISPVAPDNSQAAKFSGGPGEIRQGIGDEQSPIHKEDSTDLVLGNTRGGVGSWEPRVIDGGRS